MCSIGDGNGFFLWGEFVELCKCRCINIVVRIFVKESGFMSVLLVCGFYDNLVL